MTHITPELRDERRLEAIRLVTKVLNTVGKQRRPMTDRINLAEAVVAALEEAGMLKLLTAHIKQGVDK